MGGLGFGRDGLTERHAHEERFLSSISAGASVALLGACARQMSAVSTIIAAAHFVAGAGSGLLGAIRNTVPLASASVTSTLERLPGILPRRATSALSSIIIPNSDVCDIIFRFLAGQRFEFSLPNIIVLLLMKFKLVILLSAKVSRDLFVMLIGFHDSGQH